MNPTTQTLVDNAIISKVTKIKGIVVDPDGDDAISIGFNYETDSPFTVTIVGDNLQLQIKPVWKLGTKLINNASVMASIDEAVAKAETESNIILEYDKRARELLIKNESYHVEKRGEEYFIVIEGKGYQKFLHANFEFETNVDASFESITEDLRAEFYSIIKAYKLKHKIS